jgi:hypothetical protein
MTPDDRRFYRAWIFANAWTEALGLGATLAIGVLLAPQFDSGGTMAIVLGASLAIASGTLLEGVLVGVAQASVLTRRLATPVARRWVIATALGAALAWVLGMTPSTVMALLDAGSTGAAPVEPPPLVQYALGAVLGAITGPILGFAQWRVLRGVTPRAARWIIANSLAWAAGMTLIFIGMDHVPWHAGTVALVASVIGVCAIAGAVVGAIHGRWLLLLLPHAGRAHRDGAVQSLGSP